MHFQGQAFGAVTPTLTLPTRGRGSSASQYPLPLVGRGRGWTYRTLRPMSLILLAAALAGCTSSDLDRDGVTTFAGDAIAWNSSLQMVDPWEYGVQQSSLKVPAERATAATASTDAAAPAGAQP